MPVDNRKLKRYDVFLIVEFRPLNGKHGFSLGITRNLSPDGFSFESTDFDPDPGEVLEFKLKHPRSDLSVSFLGEISWKKHSWYQCVRGVKFHEMSEETSEKILEMMSSVSNMPDETLMQFNNTEETQEKGGEGGSAPELTHRHLDGLMLESLQKDSEDVGNKDIRHSEPSRSAGALDTDEGHNASREETVCDAETEKGGDDVHEANEDISVTGIQESGEHSSEPETMHEASDGHLPERKNKIKKRMVFVPLLLVSAVALIALSGTYEKYAKRLIQLLPVFTKSFFINDAVPKKPDVVTAGAESEELYGAEPGESGQVRTAPEERDKITGQEEVISQEDTGTESLYGGEDREKHSEMVIAGPRPGFSYRGETRDSGGLQTDSEQINQSAKKDEQIQSEERVKKSESRSEVMKKQPEVVIAQPQTREMTRERPKEPEPPEGAQTADSGFQENEKIKRKDQSITKKKPGGKVIDKQPEVVVAKAQAKEIGKETSKKPEQLQTSPKKENSVTSSQKKSDRENHRQSSSEPDNSAPGSVGDRAEQVMQEKKRDTAPGVQPAQKPKNEKTSRIALVVKGIDKGRNNNGSSTQKVNLKSPGDQGIFRESFENNANEWVTVNTKRALVELKNGEYLIENKRDRGTYIIINDPGLAASSNYVIESSVKKVGGPDTHFYGLIFGAKDTLNNYVFQITDKGDYSIGKYHNGRFQDLKKGNESNIIENQNAVQVFKIIGRENNTLFYINNKYIAKVSDLLFDKNNRVGFIVKGKSKVAVDYLHISTLFR